MSLNLPDGCSPSAIEKFWGNDLTPEQDAAIAALQRAQHYAGLALECLKLAEAESYSSEREQLKADQEEVLGGIKRELGL